MKRFLNERILLLILVLLPLIVIREWFLPHMPQTHDAEVHISRAAMMAASIKEGNILPRWGGYFNWGYGTSSIMFLYPGLPYAAAAVHLMTGLTFIPIYKIFMIVAYVGSGIAWFRWMRLLGLSPIASFVGSFFYLLAPYRLVNVFVRGALAEHLGFFLFPLLMIAAIKVLKKQDKKNFLFFSLIVAVQIVTHNLSALLYLPIVAVFPFLAKQISSLSHFSISTLFRYYGAITVGILLTSFFWMPALVESKYTHASWMFTNRDWYADHFLEFRQLVWSRWGYGWSLPGVENDGLSFQFGVAQWIVLIGGIGALVLRKKKFSPSLFHLMLVSILLVAVGTFMVLPISNFVWHLSSIFPKFQFPWRFLSYVVIGTSLLSGVLTETLKRHRAFLTILAVLPIVTTIPYWRTAGPSSLTEQFLTVDYVGTSDTGETTPIWAIRFQEKKAKAPVEIVSTSGMVEIQQIERLLERHRFRVSASAPSRLVDNTLYFPGWTVYVDGNKTPVEFHDENWRGLITFPVDRGTHDIVVVFEETTLRKVSNALSLVIAALLIAIFLRHSRGS